MATVKRPQLSMEALDERIVPAALVDLSTSDASAAVNEGLVRQVDAPASPWLRGGRGWGWGYWRSWGRVDPEFGRLDSFLSIDRNGVEQGYNTDARRTSFDEGNTHAIRLNEVSRINVDGVAYREFLLNVNQNSRSPFISLDDVRIYVGNSASPSTTALNNMTPVWSLDGGGDISIRLNDNLNRNSRTPDMVLLVPETAFAGANGRSFVTLYSKFSGANEGAEEWSVRRNTVIQAPPPPVSPPPPSSPTGAATLSGRVLGPVFEEGEQSLEGIGGVKVTLSGGSVDGELVTYTNDLGNFSFDVPTGGTYQITVSDYGGLTSPSYGRVAEANPGDADGDGENDDGFGAGDTITDIMLADGAAGTGYEFVLGFSE